MKRRITKKKRMNKGKGRQAETKEGKGGRRVTKKEEERCLKRLID